MKKSIYYIFDFFAIRILFYIYYIFIYYVFLGGYSSGIDFFDFLSKVAIYKIFIAPSFIHFLLISSINFIIFIDLYNFLIKTKKKINLLNLNK